MWRSDTSSEVRRRVGALLAPIAAALLVAAPADALTAEAAVALAFPGCAIERNVVFLTPEQLAAAAALAGEPVESALVTRFRVRCNGALAGTAYLDTHRVRTLSESLLVALDAGGAVARVEVLVFGEPREYQPRAPWYGQLSGRGLDAELSLSGGVRPVAGATLTARATVAAVRRVLAVHRVLAGEAPP